MLLTSVLADWLWKVRGRKIDVECRDWEEVLFRMGQFNCHSVDKGVLLYLKERRIQKFPLNKVGDDDIISSPLYKIHKSSTSKRKNTTFCRHKNKAVEASRLRGR